MILTGVTSAWTEVGPQALTMPWRRVQDAEFVKIRVECIDVVDFQMLN